MSNLVKQSQLSQVAVGLWEKVKERYQGVYENATYDETTKVMTLTKKDGTTTEIALTDLASLSQNNSFNGENIFKDIFLGGESHQVGGEVYSGNRGGATGTKKFGRRDYDSHVNNGTGYVRSLLIGVTGKTVGEEVTVNIWEVKKGTTKADDLPVLIANQLKLPIQDNASWVNNSANGNSHYVEFRINKKYETPTYFIYQVDPSTQADRVTGVTLQNSEFIFIGDDVEVTQTSIASSSVTDTMGIHALICGKVNLMDLVLSGGSVKTVNGQSADGQGNVVVGISHIDQLQQTLDEKVNQSQIGNEANKIPLIESNGKLATSIIPDLAITSVQSVADQAAALALVTAGTIQTGDVVILTQEKNKVYMHNGTTTGNFGDQFIELSLGNGSVKNINGQVADSTGKVTLTATVTQGATGDIVLAVGDQSNFATLQCMTDTEVQAIINQFV